MDQIGGKGGMKRRNVPARITCFIFIYLMIFDEYYTFLMIYAVLFEKKTQFIEK